MKEKRAQKNQVRVMLLPEYGKQKLLTYADSFQELAEVFAKMDTEPETEDGQAAEQDRSAYLYRRKAFENREIMAEHLSEMAQILEEAAQVSFSYLPLSERRTRQIAHALKLEGVLVKEIYYIETSDKRMEIGASLAVEKGKKKTGEEMAALFSVLFDKRLMVSAETDYYLDEKYRDFRFREEPRFVALAGVAKAVKETESVSGDNFCQFEGDKDGITMMLSDGMGSGEKACTDSMRVLELMERMLAAGFSGNAAVRMVNTSLSVGGGENNMSTLDVCRLDLYEGVMELTKVGAASTYLKRDTMVEQISARNLPLGVFGRLEPEVTTRRLMDGDYIIMVSDGVADGLAQGIGEEVLSELISKTSLENPKEMANSILNYVIRVCKGSIRDDMTVVVAGIWENT